MVGSSADMDTGTIGLFGRAAYTVHTGHVFSALFGPSVVGPLLFSSTAADVEGKCTSRYKKSVLL
jgi:hypothetical protein